MNTTFKKYVLPVLLVLMLAVVACEGEVPAGSITSQSEVYLLWEPDAAAEDFIEQSAYTGMTREELAQYYFTYNVKWELKRASDVGLADVFAIPMSRVGTTLPLGEVIAPVVGTSPIMAVLGGSAIAYATTLTSEYQSKMATLEEARRIPADARVLIPIAVEATIKTGKMIHEGVGPITYVISSGMKCFTNMSMWFFGQSGDEPKVKQESEGSGPCTPDKVNKMLSEFVRRGIEAGVSLETMNEIRSSMQQSIWAKFGW